MPFYANVLNRGPVKWRDTPVSVGVFEEKTSGSAIGQADVTGYEAGGIAHWRLVIDEEPLSGEWILEDGEFVPAQ